MIDMQLAVVRQTLGVCSVISQCLSIYSQPSHKDSGMHRRSKEFMPELIYMA